MVTRWGVRWTLGAAMLLALAMPATATGAPRSASSISYTGILVVGRDQPMDYAKCKCPVSERAGYQESVWLPQFLLIGDDADAQDVIRAVEKVVAHLGDLAKADPKLAGLKACSRGLRAKMERMKNY